jgi:hypothetical protein
MNSFIRKHPNLNHGLRLLKVQWWRLSECRVWRHLRALAAREHLHAHKKDYRVLPCAALLRRRRIQLATYFASQGLAIDPALLEYTLPKEPSGYWLQEICPIKGPNNAFERDRGKRCALPLAYQGER